MKFKNHLLTTDVSNKQNEIIKAEMDDKQEQELWRPVCGRKYLTSSFQYIVDVGMWDLSTGPIV